MGQKALVIGAGVSGLTTASCLMERGHEVVVVAEEDASRTTSVVAGALWEWPPAVCGHHSDVESLARSKPWCLASYRRFAALADSPETGVSMRMANFYFYHPVAECETQWAKMQELRTHVCGFVHDPRLIAENGINPDLGLVDAYCYRAPIIDTTTYTRWLRQGLERRGCRFVWRRIIGSLRDRQQQLLREFDAGVIVNCSGLGAIDLAGDEMFPLRGALVRVARNGSPALADAHCIQHDDEVPHQNMIYVVPRGTDRVLLGGIAEAGEWDTGIDLDNSDTVRDIWRRCRRFLPELAKAELDTETPVVVGLRPARRRNVRLEHDRGSRIVHNYGHGGSGFTFSWGCAQEVADLLHEL